MRLVWERGNGRGGRGVSIIERDDALIHEVEVGNNAICPYREAGRHLW